MYKAPTQEVFEEMKKNAIEVWNTYDNTYGYVDEKIEKINSIENIQDNAMMFYRMFDSLNQSKFNDLISNEAKVYIDNNN